MGEEEERNTDCKVGDKRPLLHGLVVGGLTPHQAEVKGQPRVIGTHNHGGQRGSWRETMWIHRHVSAAWFNGFGLVVNTDTITQSLHFNSQISLESSLSLNVNECQRTIVIPALRRVFSPPSYTCNSDSVGVFM